ncbi:ABC transporter permease [Vibrio sp. qd031]|uniref:carbohydrate ABC transporter permease n=1 Tax=Vibrio sp. qd031 TaxID=1603038 RepID=UPI000A10BC72|nr:sugar ABC transporter permease [Vibrio sp. qd031]ORT52763.1 ABC transporter permease [Vibrio sp. qd031]
MLRSLLSSNSGLAWLLLLPALVLLSCFTYFPAFNSFYSSVFTSSYSNDTGLVLMDNLADLKQDPVFWKALVNNFWYGIVTVPVSMGLALIMALWVNEKFVGRGFLRLCYFLPTMLPMVAAANIWLFFYSPNIGLFNRVLAMFGIEGLNWLGDPNTALGAIILLAIWKEAGFFMIFYLAALQAIPKELNDAARIESPSYFYRLRRFILPLLGPTTLFVFINAVINAFKVVDHLFILTKGGPNNASTLLLYYIYETAFAYFDREYAALLTMVLLVILAGCSAIQFLLSRKRVHYR